MYIWMMVTRDKYELPLAIADTARELAKLTGYHVGSIVTGANGVKNGKLKRSYFRKVNIEEE